MRKHKLLKAASFLLVLLIVSCQSKKEKTPALNKETLETKVNYLEPKAVVAEFIKEDLTKDFLTYWTYHYGFVKLFKDFIPIDEDGAVIKKEKFLEKLNTGLYFPLLQSTKDSIWQYTLVKLPENILDDAGPVIADYSKHQLSNFHQEKTFFPDFKFEDVNGINYSNASTNGKVIVLKCWFIACKPCVAEMPRLNSLVKKYNKNKDVLFLSLASDDRVALMRFLKATEFDYRVVPNQDNFMSNKLGVFSYPTHILIDKQGKIVKIVNEVADLEKLLALLQSPIIN